MFFNSDTEEDYDERSSLLAKIIEFWDAEKLITTHGPESEDDDFNGDIFNKSEVFDAMALGSSTQGQQEPTQGQQDKKLADRERDVARDKGKANIFSIKLIISLPVAKLEKNSKQSENI